MMEADAEAACGRGIRAARTGSANGWGRTAGKIGFHAGKVAMERPRVRGLAKGIAAAKLGAGGRGGLARSVGR